MALKVIKKPSRQTELLLEAEQIIRDDKNRERREQRQQELKRTEDYRKWVQAHPRDRRPSQYRVGKSPGSYR